MDPYIDDRLRSDKPTDFLGFIDTLRKLWDAAGNSGDIVRNEPKGKESDVPVITYRLLERYPHPAFKEKKPRMRGTVRHPDRPSELIELYGQIFQVYIAFDVYARTDEEADNLASEFETFMLQYKGFFKQEGVKEILFYKQGQDELYNKYHVPLAKRPLVFDMQFEKVTPRFLNRINQVAVQANIDNSEDN